MLFTRDVIYCWPQKERRKLRVHGIYNLLRIKKSDLFGQASNLLGNGFEASWESKQAEKKF